MRKPGFFLTYCVILIAQILLMNFGNFSQYLSVFFLPVMVLCIPLKRGPVFAMFAAFATGFAADFLASGMLGLIALALVPVAACRRGIIRLVFGSEMLARGEDISLRKQGLEKALLATLMVTAIFLLIYIWADSAGTRPFWFNGVRFLSSLTASALVSLFVFRILTSDEIRWK